ncbi:MAG: glycoside hydrolase family 16 protein [Bacteroidota bacterium]
MAKTSLALRILFLLAVTIISCLPGPLQTQQDKEGYTSPLQYNQWKLAWQDEFDGLEIDTAKWTPEVNDWGGGNNELQYYTDRPENSYVENGTLVIVGQKEEYKTRSYTSARLNTKYKGDWKYGRFDVRAKLPKGWGMWPAIWLLPTDNRYGAWYEGGEIDIAEVLGREPTQLHGTVHFGHKTPTNRPSSTGEFKLQQGDFSNRFHVFSIEWEPHVIRWFLDNKLYHTVKVTKPLDERYHLLLNLAIGGKWPGQPQANTVFPINFYIDYVRVFERDRKETALKSSPPPAQSGN